ncbi:MAG: PASTA domain-containing protein [Acidimicrobiia bacterium]
MSETRDDQVHELMQRLGAMAPAPPPFPDATAAAPPARRPRVLALAAAAVLVVALIGGAWYAVRDDGDGAQLTVGDDEAAGDPSVVDDAPRVMYADTTGVWLDGEQVADGPACCAAWSGDGVYFAYERNETLYVKLHDETLVAPNVIRWAWSPTEPVLAVVHDPGAGPGLHLFRVEDDRVVNIRSIPDGTDFAWSHGGERLAFAHPTGSNRGVSVFDVLDNGRRTSEPRAVPVAVQGDVQLASFSPDATHLLAFHDDMLIEIDLGTGAVETRTASLVKRSWIQWEPGGGSFLAVEGPGVNATDPRVIVQCTSAECEPRFDNATDPALAPDGRRIAFVREGALWIDEQRIDVAGGGTSVPYWIDDNRITFVRGARLWLLTLSTSALEPLSPELTLVQDPAAMANEPTDLNTRYRWDNAFALSAPIGPTPPPETVGPTETTTPDPTTPAPPPETAPVAPQPDPDVTVPDVRGLTGDEAKHVFEALGFEVDVAGIVAGTVDRPDDVVRWQEPPAEVTVNVPRAHAVLYTCPPTAQCVLPPPEYVDGYAAATDWLPVHADAEGFGEVLTQPFADVAAAEAALTTAVATASHEAQVASTRIDQGTERTEMWVQVRKVPDPATLGWDFRFTVAATADGWRIRTAESRDLCAPNVPCVTEP